MIIKLAQPDDLAEIDDLFRGFASPVAYDPDRVILSLKNMIQNNTVIAAVIDDKIVGGLGGYFFPSLFNDDVYFVTMFSYFKEGFRKYYPEFLEMVEGFLETSRASIFFVGVPYYQDQKKKHRFFTMRGFDLYETHYAKRLKGEKSNASG